MRILDKASVPVIKLYGQLDQYKVAMDLTFESLNHEGLEAAQFMKTLRARLPPLGPLVLTLKSLLHAKGVSDPFTGGLSSYALILMVATSLLKSKSETKSYATNYGKLMMDFLEMFGRDFQPLHDAVVCNTVQLNIFKFSRHTNMGSAILTVSQRSRSVHANQPHLLIVHDPVTKDNNVGRSCFAFPTVQRVFAEALAKLLSHMVRVKEEEDKGCLLEEVFKCSGF